MESEKSKAVIGVVRASRPLFRSRHDRVAFAVHATFLTSGYWLTATGPAAYAADALCSSSTEEVGIEHWNEADDEYAFVYISPEDSKKVLVKCVAMDDKLVVGASKDGAAETVPLEIDVDEFIGVDGAASYSGLLKNLDKLVKSLDTEILSKLNGSSRPRSSANDVGRENSEGSRQRINEPSLAAREPWGPQVLPSRILDLTVIGARNLKYVNYLTNMKVYIVVSLEGNLGCLQKSESSVDVHGGRNPTWRFNVKLYVDEPSTQQNRLTIHFKLRSCRTFKKEDIGEVVIPVRELLDSAPAYGEAIAIKPVCMQSGPPEGELWFSYKFIDNLTAEFATQAGHGNAQPLPPGYEGYLNRQGGMGLLAGLEVARLTEALVFNIYEAAGGF